MSDLGMTVGLIKALAPSPEIDPEQVKQDVEDWLDDHPEATTTVQDGAITKAKLNASLQGTVDDVDKLKSAVDALTEGWITENNLHFTTQGAILISNGVISPLTGYDTWAYSDAIELPENVSQIITNVNNALGSSDSLGYAIYNANREYVTGGQFPFYADGIYASNIDFLDTYKYIRFTNYSANGDHSGLYLTFCIGTADKLKQAFDKANAIGSDIRNSIIGTVINGAFISSDTANRIGYYQIQGSKVAVCDVSKINGKTVFISTKQVSTTYRLLYGFVNADGTVFSVYTGLANSQEVLTEKPVTVPDGAKTLFCNCQSSAPLSLYTDNIQFLYEYPANELKNKTIVTYGDSLTWYDTQNFTWGDQQGTPCIGFQSYLRTKLFMGTTNRGASGETTPQICERILNANDLGTFNYMTIMGGDNDDRLNVTIGTVQPVGSTFDTTTICGALQAAIEYALEENPNLRIVLMTEPMGWTYQNNSLDRVSDLIPTAYRNVAKQYGIPVIDLWEESGINEFTRNAYYLDPDDTENTDYMYHPNNAGWARLSKIICQKFKDI